MAEEEHHLMHGVWLQLQVEKPPTITILPVYLSRDVSICMTEYCREDVQEWNGYPLEQTTRESAKTSSPDVNESA